MKLPYEIIDYIYSFDDNRFLIKSYNLCMCELKERFEIKDGMRIFFDYPIEMDDGINLRADIFCP